jgi:hypothetical protein
MSPGTPRPCTLDLIALTVFTHGFPGPVRRAGPGKWRWWASRSASHSAVMTCTDYFWQMVGPETYVELSKVVR